MMRQQHPDTLLDRNVREMKRNAALNSGNFPIRVYDGQSELKSSGLQEN